MQMRSIRRCRLSSRSLRMFWRRVQSHASHPVSGWWRLRALVPLWWATPAILSLVHVVSSCLVSRLGPFGIVVIVLFDVLWASWLR